MVVRINHKAFPYVYGGLKPSELKMYLHLVNSMDLNNEVLKGKEELMLDLKIKQEKTYYAALTKLRDMKLVNKSETKVDVLEVNEDIVKRLPTQKDVTESQEK